MCCCLPVDLLVGVGGLSWLLINSVGMVQILFIFVAGWCLIWLF